jgi:SulP family sulfate permease
MYTLSHVDELSLTPWKGELSGYTLETFKRDLLAGLEVSLLTVPQAIAYALVAGLPASCGLYAAIFSALTAVLFGSSRYLIVGPVNAIAILLQAGTAEILYSHFWEASAVEKESLALQIMTQIALLTAIFQMLISVFKLGRFTQFVSHSVVVGYLAGSALAIITNQLFTFAGMPPKGGISSLFEKLYYFGTHLTLANLPTIAVGGGSLILLIVLKKASKRLPAAALMLAGAALAAVLLNLSPYAPFSRQIALIGSTMDEFVFFPIFSWPAFNAGMVNQMLPCAFAIALLSIIETTCTAKSITATSGYRISVNQEILSVGLANLASSCTGSMPVSVSNSRSRFNLQSGAKTRMAAFWNAVLVAMIVGYLGSFVNLIPLSALAALLFVTALTLVDYKQLILCLKSTNADAFVMITTFLACLFLNLDTAFYIGVILSISLYLKKAAMPELAEYAIEDTGVLRSLDQSRAYLRKAIRVIKVEGELFFGSADIFYTTLKAIADDDQTTRVILLQLKNARDMDATTCLALMQLQEFLERAGRHLVMCGMTYDMWDVMSNSGVIAKIGKGNVFVFDERHPQLYMQRALARAKELAHIAHPPVAEGSVKQPTPVPKMEF